MKIVQNEAGGWYWVETENGQVGPFETEAGARAWADLVAGRE